jgi:hypothetical protein
MSKGSILDEAFTLKDTFFGFILVYVVLFATINVLGRLGGESAIFAYPLFVLVISIGILGVGVFKKQYGLVGGYILGSMSIFLLPILFGV